MGNERKTIDGRSYVIAKYNVEHGLELFGKLQKLLARPAGIFLNGLMKGIRGSGEFNFDSLLNADVDLPEFFESLLSKIEPRELPELAREILIGTKIQIDNELHNIDLNLHFHGSYLSLFKLLGHVLQYQYEDFLGVLVAKKGQPLATGNRIQAKASI